MILGLEVHQQGDDGSTLARTTVGIDGSVITALRPELLDAPQLVHAHLEEVGRRVGQWSARVRRAGQLMSYGPYAAVAGTIGCSATAIWEGARGELLQLAQWALGAVALELLRRALPRLARWWVRRWLAKVAGAASTPAVGAGG